MSNYEYNRKMKGRNDNNTKETIKDVFSDNFEQEIKKISKLLEIYPYIAMDTEFPGIVYNNSYKQDFSSYPTIKANVDRLKVIQIGITLSDEMGNYPEEVSTWQFNIDFNIKKDLYSHESISLLMSSGINFEIIAERGISIETFGELILTSGLVINDSIHWITFHGSYDFAYFLKILTAQLLPDKVETFVNDLDLYFKNYYDIRHLIQNLDSLKGSLNKIAYELNVERTGIQHQAGSDSLITSKVFFKLRELYYLNDDDIFNKGRNQIYCLSNNNYDEQVSYQDTNSTTTNYYNNYNTYNIGQNVNNVNNITGLNGLNSMNNLGMAYQAYDSGYVFGLNNQNYAYYNNNINVTLHNGLNNNIDILKEKNSNTNSISHNGVGVNPVGNTNSKNKQKKIIKGV